MRRRIIGPMVMTAVLSLAAIGCVQEPLIVDTHREPMRATPLDRASFDSLVVGSGAVALVEFYSGHCSVCADMVWVIDSLAGIWGDSVLVGAIDTDSDTTWKRYGITSVPAYLLFKDGEPLVRRSYVRSDSSAFDTLQSLLQSLLDGALEPDTSDSLPVQDSIPRGIVIVDKTNFDSLTSVAGRVAMIDFYSPTCGACLAMDSVVVNLSHRFEGKALIGKVNVLQDDSLKNVFGVLYVPTFVFLNGGREVRTITGITPGGTLAAVLDSILASIP